MTNKSRIMKTLEQKAQEYIDKYGDEVVELLEYNIKRLTKSHEILRIEIEDDLYNESLKIASLNIAQQIDLNKQILKELTK